MEWNGPARVAVARHDGGLQEGDGGKRTKRRAGVKKGCSVGVVCEIVCVWTKRSRRSKKEVCKGKKEQRETDGDGIWVGGWSVDTEA